MKKKSYLTLFSFFLFVACSTNSINEICLSENSYSSTHLAQISHILSTGDVIMYDSIYDRFADDGAMDALLSISIIMANKYEYAKAYYDIYEILTSLYQVYGLNADYLDSTTLQLACYYLERSKEKGYDSFGQ